MATAHTPTRTPTARKSLPGSLSAISPNVTATESPISLQKRKWQGGSIALPILGLAQPGNGGGSALVAPMTAPKRPKIEEQVKVEDQPQQQQHLGVSASPLRVPNGLIHPAMNPLFNPQAISQPLVQPSIQPSIQPSTQRSLRPSLQPPQQPTQPGIPQQIFLAALKRNNALYPVAPKTSPIGSRRIDAIAHSMWDVVFTREDMMTEVTMKAALFAPLKLRALARLNWLPSWWFLREMAVTLMKQQGWLVDDSERQGEWREAVEWCKKAETKCFGAGAGTGAATQDGGLSAVQIQELKQAAAAAATRKVES